MRDLYADKCIDPDVWEIPEVTATLPERVTEEVAPE
jgi:hypothetical protein